MKRKTTKLLILISILILSITLSSCNQGDDTWSKIQEKKVAYNVDKDTSTLSGNGHLNIETDDPTCISASLMFQDDEKWEVTTNRQLRGWYVNQPIKIELLDGKTYRISNFCTKDIKDVEIWINFKDGRSYLLRKFDVMPALMQNTYVYPFATKRVMMQDKSGEYVPVAPMSSVQQEVLEKNKDGQYLEIVCNDPTYKKISSIKCKWYIWFSTNPDNANYQRIKPVNARRWMEAATDFAYVFSSPLFLVSFNYAAFPTNNPDPNGGGTRQFWNNNRVEYTSQDQYDALMQQIYNKQLLCVGLVSGTNSYAGLAGGNSLNVISWALGLDGNQVITHEFGHCLGYSHNSSFCYGNFEYYPRYFNQTMLEFMDLKHEMPYMSPNFTYNYRKTNRRSLLQEYLVFFGPELVEQKVLTQEEYQLLKNKRPVSDNKTNLKKFQAKWVDGLAEGFSDWANFDPASYPKKQAILDMIKKYGKEWD